MAFDNPRTVGPVTRSKAPSPKKSNLANNNASKALSPKKSDSANNGSSKAPSSKKGNSANNGTSKAPSPKKSNVANNSTSSSSTSPVPRLENDPFAIDMNDYLAELAERQKLVDRSEIGGQDILETMDVTKNHYHRRDRIMGDFLRCIGEEYTDTEPKVQVFEKMLELIPNPFTMIGAGEREPEIPRLIVAISGDREPCKQELANRAFCCWQTRAKKAKCAEGECPFYQPSSQNMELRTLIGKLKAKYNFKYVLGDFNQFPGSLGSVLKALYSQRLEEWGAKGYGQKSEKCSFKPEDVDCLYDLSVFDEDNFIHLCCKVLIVFGSRVGFRGQNEHYTLEMHQVGHGFFPDDHPHWPGLEWWGIVDWGTFKTHQLSLNNPYTHKDEYMAKFPVLSNGRDEGDVANDAGGAIGRWVERVKQFELANKNPGKCKTRFFRRVEEHKIQVNQHLGENTINNLFKFAFKLMGVSNYEEVSAHATRHWFVTRLANSPLLNLEEVRVAARHTTPQMTVTYMDQAMDSSDRRVLALTRGAGKEPVVCGPQKAGNDVVGGVDAAENIIPKVNVHFTVPESSGSSSFESLAVGAPIEKDRVEPSPCVKSPKKAGNVYVMRGLSEPSNEFRSAARVLEEQGRQCYESPIRLRGRASLPVAVTSSPAKLKSPEIFRSGPKTPDSYRTGRVWLSQFDCSPDRESTYSSPSRGIDKPYSEATQNEYSGLQESMENLRRAREDTNSLLEQQVSHRRMEIRKLRGQIESLQRNEKRRQEYIRGCITYGNGSVGIGEREWKKWREEEEVFERTYHNSHYRLRSLQHAWERDRQQLETSRRERNERDFGGRISGAMERNWNDGVAHSNAGNVRNDSDESFGRHVRDWDMDTAIAREMHERCHRRYRSRSREEYRRRGY